MVNSFEDVINGAKKMGKKRVAIAWAADDVILESVKAADEAGLADCVLIGIKDQILKSAEAANYNVKDENIVEAKTEREAGILAVELINAGKADMPMKGMMQTSDFLRPILNKETGLRDRNDLSQIGVYEKPQGGLLFMTDCAMTIAPDLQGKITILENAVAVVRKLGIDCPKVALLSFLEQVNLSSEASRDAAIISKMADRGQIKNCIVDGPLALDNAIVPYAAEHKGIKSPVAGAADIIVVPNIDVGNALSKSFSFVAGLKFGAVVAGAKVPVIMSRRADSIESKLQSLALCRYLMN